MLFVRAAPYLHAQAAIKFIAFFVAHSIVAFVRPEIVNYIEHYGLPHQPVDLVLTPRSGQAWVIEVKRSTAPTVSGGFHQVAIDVKAQRRLLVAPVAQAFRPTGDVEVMALLAAVTG